MFYDSHSLQVRTTALQKISRGVRLGFGVSRVRDSCLWHVYYREDEGSAGTTPAS
jgi:hypothetical protein